MEIKVKVPSKLSELTLEQYAKYSEMLVQYEAMKDEKSNPEIFYMLKTLEIFCGINYEDGMKIRVQDVKKLVHAMEKLLSEKPELIRTFDVGDTTFGFIPQLDDMTFGEYIDVDTNLGDWNNMHKVVAVLYRPIKKRMQDKYIIDDYKGDLFHDVMKKTPLDVVFSSLIFFYHLGIDLSNAMTKFLEEEAKATDLAPSKILDVNGVGINRSIRLLKETLQNMTI